MNTKELIETIITKTGLPLPTFNYEYGKFEIKLPEKYMPNKNVVSKFQFENYINDRLLERE
jgi:hypothetical protein